MLFWKMSFSFQNLMTSFSRARKSSAVETFWIMVFNLLKSIAPFIPWDERRFAVPPNLAYVHMPP